MAYSYNVDYWPGNTSIVPSKEMLKIRYANYPKDYFMGISPNSQYGSVALLPSLFDKSQSPGIITVPGSPQGFLLNNQGTTSVIVNNTSTSPRIPALNSDLSALSIRATEYLQRWKEVVQFSSKDYSDQMAAQFGIKTPEYMGNHAHEVVFRIIRYA